MRNESVHRKFVNDSMDLPGPSVVGRLSGKPMAGQAADALQWTGSVFPARLAAQVRLFQRPIFILRYLSALDLPSETKLGCTQQELALLYAGHRLVCSVHVCACTTSGLFTTSACACWVGWERSCTRRVHYAHTRSMLCLPNRGKQTSSTQYWHE